MSPERAKMLAAINRRSKQLRSLIDDLLTLSKLETGAAAMDVGPVDLAHMLNEAADAVAPSVAAGGLNLITAPPAPGTLIEGDASQLDRVLLNLLSNAVKYTRAGGEIRLKASATAAGATIQVSDTGIGIPGPDQEKLFTRFFRASNAATSQVPGTGLGLAIVSGIVAQHHGTVQISSAEGAGTTVTIQLPRRSPAGADGSSSASWPIARESSLA